jgi:hypothetical protein
VHVLHMLVPQPRGFAALQQLPLGEFRVVITALVEATQRRWPAAETGAMEMGQVTGSYFGSTDAMVGRCRMTLSNPC